VFWKADPTLAQVKSRRATDGRMLIHFYGWASRYDKWVAPGELRCATDAEVEEQKELALRKK
jgi:hypothetical protein